MQFLLSFKFNVILIKYFESNSILSLEYDRHTIYVDINQKFKNYDWSISEIWKKVTGKLYPYMEFASNNAGTKPAFL